MECRTSRYSPDQDPAEDRSRLHSLQIDSRVVRGSVLGMLCASPITLLPGELRSTFRRHPHPPTSPLASKSSTLTCLSTTTAVVGLNLR